MTNRGMIMEAIKAAFLATVSEAFDKGSNMTERGWDKSEALEVVLKDILMITLETANEFELDIE